MVRSLTHWIFDWFAMKQSLIFLMLGWYFCSITLSLYNKWMFDPNKGLQISCPILVTSSHQFILWLISFSYLKYYGIKEDHDQQSLHKYQSGNWNFYLKYLVPTAVATAGDIGFGNVSFKFVPLTVYTVIKSASIAFVLLFGCMFKLEKFHWKLVMIVFIMFSGVVMMVFVPQKDVEKEQDESRLIFGSSLVLISSCLSGLRWVYTQLILKSIPQRAVSSSSTSDLEPMSEADAKKPHPVNTIYQLAPIMGFVLFFTALIVEKPFPGILESKLFRMNQETNEHTFESIFRGLVLLLIPGIEVFFMTICEFGILQTAHVLTLSIAGIVKELLTILCGLLLLGERLSGLHNWLGMTIILLDVAYYNYFRLQQNRELTSVAEKDDEEFIPYSITADSMMQEYELDVIVSK